MATNTTSYVPRIVGVGVDEHDARYLEVDVRLAGRCKRRMVSLDDLHDERAMTRLGLVTTDVKTAFRRNVQTAVRSNRPDFRVATRPGPRGRAFVLPCGDIVGDDARVRVALPSPIRRADNGCLSEWQRVTALAEGNTRLMLGLVLPFVGPVVAFMKDLELPMIELVGHHGAGKSTIARAAASVWGGPDPSTWNQTVNHVEELAVARSGTFLPLDELGTIGTNDRAGFHALRGAVMRLFEGEKKGRMHEAAGWWRLAVLSTSNLSLDEMAGRVGIRHDDAQLAALRSRLIDVPMPVDGRGAYEDLHGSATIPEFVERVSRILGDNHGVAGVAFVRRMLAWQHRLDDSGEAWLAEKRRTYRDKAARRLPASAVAAFPRVHEVFATIYASGCLAIELGVLPWTNRELVAALLACEAAHVVLVTQGTSTTPHAGSVVAPIDRLRQHVDRRRSSFVDLRHGPIDPSRHEHGTCPGYVNKHRDGTLELLFPEPVLLRVCGSDQGRLDQLKTALGRMDALRSESTRNVVKRTIYSSGSDRREYVLAVREDLFGQGERRGCA